MTIWWRVGARIERREATSRVVGSSAMVLLRNGARYRGVSCGVVGCVEG